MRERVLLVGLILVGLIVPAIVEVYDTTSVVLRIGLSLTNVAVSFTVLWVALGRLVPSDQSLPVTLWGLLGWCVIPLSQAPYSGYSLVPVEVMVGAFLAGFRGREHIPMIRALLPVSVARVLALAATLSARALF